AADVLRHHPRHRGVRGVLRRPGRSPARARRPHRHLGLGPAHPARAAGVLRDAAPRGLALLARPPPAAARDPARTPGHRHVGGGDRVRHPLRLQRVQGPPAGPGEGCGGRRGARHERPAGAHGLTARRRSPRRQGRERERQPRIAFPPRGAGAPRIRGYPGAMTAQRTLVLLKPDAVQRGLRGEILRRIEAKGYDIIALAQRTATAEELAAHYAEHEGKPFYPGLVEYMGSAPLVAIVAEGVNVIPAFRSLAGATNPTEAAPGTSPGALSCEQARPAIQTPVPGSDSAEAAARAIGIWFPELG